jgi:hypothetical protein
MMARIVKIERNQYVNPTPDGMAYFAVYFDGLAAGANASPVSWGFWAVDELDAFTQATAWAQEREQAWKLRS